MQGFPRALNPEAPSTCEMGETRFVAYVTDDPADEIAAEHANARGTTRPGVLVTGLLERCYNFSTTSGLRMKGCPP